MLPYVFQPPFASAVSSPSCFPFRWLTPPRPALRNSVHWLAPLWDLWVGRSSPYASCVLDCHAWLIWVRVGCKPGSGLTFSVGLRPLKLVPNTLPPARVSTKSNGQFRRQWPYTTTCALVPFNSVHYGVVDARCVPNFSGPKINRSKHLYCSTSGAIHTYRTQSLALRVHSYIILTLCLVN